MSALAALALRSGLPLFRSILQNKLGDANGSLAESVLVAIAERAKVKPEELDALAESDPPKALDAMRAVAEITPELIALHVKGLEHQNALLMAEQEEGGWKAAWRPAGMWMIGFLWLWQIIILHVLNAIFKIALPPAPWEHLVTLTIAYLGLYMGGHTVKDAVSKWVGAKH